MRGNHTAQTVQKVVLTATTVTPRRQQTAPIRPAGLRAVGNRLWLGLRTIHGLAHTLLISAGWFVTVAALKLLVG